MLRYCAMSYVLEFGVKKTAVKAYAFQRLTKYLLPYSLILPKIVIRPF